MLVRNNRLKEDQISDFKNIFNYWNKKQLLGKRCAF